MKPLYQRVWRNIKQPGELLSWFIYQMSRGNNWFFVSMPCSGTHWLRFLIAKSIVERYDLDYEFTDIEAREIIPSFRAKTDRFRYNNRLEIPRVQHSHDPYSPLYYNRRVILLLRNLRDSLASHYERYRTWENPEISFGDFLREKGMDHYAVQSLHWRVSFLNSWGGNRYRTADFKVVKYEQLEDDTEGTLNEVLDYLGLSGMGQEQLSRIVDFASKENMQRLEQSSEEIQGSPKVNKARSGRHESYFDEDSERYFREYLNTNLKYDFGYGYTS